MITLAIYEDLRKEKLDVHWPALSFLHANPRK